MRASKVAIRFKRANRLFTPATARVPMLSSTEGVTDCAHSLPAALSLEPFYDCLFSDPATRRTWLQMPSVDIYRERVAVRVAVGIRDPALRRPSRARQAGCGRRESHLGWKRYPLEKTCVE